MRRGSRALLALPALGRNFSSSILHLPTQRVGPFLVSEPSAPAGPGRSDSPLVLTATLKNAATFADLEEIIRTKEQFFNGVHDAVACTSAGRLLRRTRLRNNVELHSYEQLPQAAANLCVARVACWLARAPTAPGQGLREATALLHSAATLSARGPPVTALVKHIAGSARQLDRHQATNCLWAAAKLSVVVERGGREAVLLICARVAELAEGSRPLEPEEAWKALWAVNAAGVADAVKPSAREALGSAAAAGWAAFFDAGGEEARFFSNPAVGAGWRGTAVKCFAAAGDMLLKDDGTVQLLAHAAERAVCGQGASSIPREQRLKLAQKCAAAAAALGLPRGAFDAVARGPA
jgi:hypothetical protein